MDSIWRRISAGPLRGGQPRHDGVLRSDSQLPVVFELASVRFLHGDIPILRWEDFHEHN